MDFATGILLDDGVGPLQLELSVELFESGGGADDVDGDDVVAMDRTGDVEENHSWRCASSGVIRFVGSHLKHSNFVNNLTVISVKLMMK